jgi:hypothetical protein
MKIRGIKYLKLEICKNNLTITQLRVILLEKE